MSQSICFVHIKLHAVIGGLNYATGRKYKEDRAKARETDEKNNLANISETETTSKDVMNRVENYY